jgi:type I restriction enzyme S subunit
MSEEWPKTALSHLADITMGQSPESSSINTDELGLPFLQGCAEFGPRTPNAKIHCSPPLRVAKSGAVLISVRAPVGTTNLADQAYCIGRGLGAVSGRVGISDSIFLLNAIEQNVGYLHRRSQGSTFAAIGSKELAELPIPDLPYTKQCWIAEILSTVDEAMEQTEALVTKLRQMKAGLMHDLFTRGVTPDGHLRPTRQEAPHLYHQTPLGWLPKEWKFLSLQTEIGIGHGFAFSGEFFSDAPPGSVLLTPGNFHRDGGLYFTAGNTKYFQGPIPKETILEHGEMVTVMTDLSPQTLILGRFAMVETTFPVLHNQRVGRVSLKNKADWEWNYLCHALNNESLRRQIIVEATGTTVRHTSPGRILSKQIARPSLDEQRTSLSMMNAINQRLVLEEEVFAKLGQQKLGLMQGLLTGRVPV